MPRKKIVYVISWKFSENDGVTRKTFEQLGEWAKSFDVLLIWLQNGIGMPDLTNFTIPEGLTVSIHNVRTNPIGYLTIINKIRSFRPNFVYTRYPFFHPLIYLISARFAPLFEINSLEKKEMFINLQKNKSISFRSIYNVVMFTRNYFLSRAKGIFFVTAELKDHQDYTDFKNRFFIPNSLSSKHFKNIKTVSYSEDLNLLFIGTKGHCWHGIEKIEAVAKRTPDFKYHIVGATGENTLNVTYYGEQNKNQIKAMMENMHICIGSLSLDVLGLKQGSPLKVREYIAAGFPIVIGYDDAAFIDEVPGWVFKGDFNNLNIDDFVNFCKRNKDIIIRAEDKNKYICLEKIEGERMTVIQGIDAKASS